MNKNNKIIHKLVKKEIDLVIKNAEKRELCKKTKCAKLYKEKKEENKIFEKEQDIKCPKTLSNDKFYDCSKIFYDNNPQLKKKYNEFIKCGDKKCKTKTNKKQYGGMKKNKSNANSNANSIKECKIEMCEKFIPEEIENIVKSMSKSFTKKMSPKAKKNFLSKMNKSSKKSNKDKALSLETCMRTYCNKGCKSTLFEDGKGSEYPKSIEERYMKIFKDKKIAKSLSKIDKTQRIELFKNKTSVLKNNFYEKIKPKRVKLIKSHKAISGCSVMMV